MIRRAKRAFRGLKTRVKVTDIFDGTDAMCADRYGFKTAEGKTACYLAPKTFTPAPSLANAVNAFPLPALDCGVFVTKFGQVYRWNVADGTTKSAGLINNVKPFMAECRTDGEYSYSVIGGGKVCVLKAETQAVTAIPFKLFCGTFHHGRVFARDFNDPYVIRWSSYGTTDWVQSIDRAGFVRLNVRGGQVRDVLSYGDKLIIVRERALCVMTALGDARHFSVSQSEEHAIPAPTPLVSVICGGQLWLYTADGLCSFNGNAVARKPFPEWARGYSAEHAVTADGRFIYYSLIKNGEKCLMEYDTDTGCFTRFAIGCGIVCPYGGKLYAFNGNALNELSADGDNGEYYWCSVKTDFGADGSKTLKRLIAEGEGDLVFEIDCDGRKRTVNGFGSLQVCERAREFAVTVRGTGALKKLSAEWEASL